MSANLFHLSLIFQPSYYPSSYTTRFLFKKNSLSHPSRLLSLGIEMPLNIKFQRYRMEGGERVVRSGTAQHQVSLWYHSATSAVLLGCYAHTGCSKRSFKQTNTFFFIFLFLRQQDLLEHESWVKIHRTIKRGPTRLRFCKAQKTNRHIVQTGERNRRLNQVVKTTCNLEGVLTIAIIIEIPRKPRGPRDV